MKKIIYMLLMAVCFTACSDDDDMTRETFTSDVFDGEWLLFDEDEPLSASEISFAAKGYSYKCTTYTDLDGIPTVDNKYYGSYSYIKKTNSLRVSALSEISGWLRTYDFEVKSVNNNSMLLVNKSFNSYDTYYRIVKKATLYADDVTGNSYLSDAGFYADEYVSLNDRIATVDGSGNITATGYGTTFVIAKSGEEKIAVKVTVESMAETYSNLIYNSTYEDIIAMFGEPDKIATASETSAAILYDNPTFDHGLKKMQINIDLQTERVTRILTLYSSTTAYNSDAAFVANNFYEVDYGGTYYCDTEEFLKSRVHILPFEQNGSYYINYGSTYHILVNGSY